MTVFTTGGKPMAGGGVVPAAYLLFRRGGRVVAADGGARWPGAADIDGRRYVVVLDAPDTMLFWNEFRTPAGRLAGFEFGAVADPTLLGSRLVRATANSTVTDYGSGGVEWRVDLTPGPADWECVQGFGSVTLRAVDDPADCALWLVNFCDREPAFPLEEWPI